MTNRIYTRVRTGTAHFAFLADAIQYYKPLGEDAREVLKEGRIAIGPPEYNPDTQKLTLDNEGRFWIEEL